MAEELVKYISNARLEIFEDSGHFAVIEEPEKFLPGGQAIRLPMTNEQFSIFNDQ